MRRRLTSCALKVLGNFLLLTFCAATGAAGGGTPTTAGTFTEVGALSSARSGPTATLLPNGKVLIAGGVGEGFQPLASAELYDPSTGRFSSTGNMTTPRSGHTATLLAEGRVLIVGGGQDLSGELYDLQSGTFTPTADTISCGPVVSVLLQDGRVFIAEGVNAEIL